MRLTAHMPRQISEHLHHAPSEYNLQLHSQMSRSLATTALFCYHAFMFTIINADQPPVVMHAISRAVVTVVSLRIYRYAAPWRCCSL